MSASLVGSEMCIRDRCCAFGHRTCRAKRRHLTGRSRGRKATPHLAPVSYTHLTLPTICSV
eukprot:12211810-Alexandrium_andersonii.AAC.1